MVVDLKVEGSAPSRGWLAGVDVLTWRAPAAAGIDLRGCGLRSLSVLDVAAPLTISLPASLESLTLAGAPAGVRVEGAMPAGSSVSLWGDAGGAVPEWAEPAGELEITGCPTLDLSRVGQMRHLRSLTVRGVAGRVSNCAAIAGATALERVAFYRCYQIDAAGFPHHFELPRLEWIMADGVSAADAKVLRERFDGFWNAHLLHPRSRAWLDRRRGDPFRTWSDWSPRLGRRASALWRDAVARLKAADSAAARERAIEDFARALDGLAGGIPLDTLQREQAGEAVRGLAARHLPRGHLLGQWEPD